MTRLRFCGQIAGLGTTSGTRLVVGVWQASPFGTFTDVMVEHPDGHRMLLAPSQQVAEFVATTYVFDEVQVVPIETAASETAADARAGHPEAGHMSVVAGPLSVRIDLGTRTAVGRALRLVPKRIATSTVWASLLDPVARLVLRGVRTRGGVGDRREWYAATDEHRIVAASAQWDGVALGRLAPVDPAVRFGFGSAPRRPSVVRLVTTVDDAGAEASGGRVRTTWPGLPGPPH